MYLAREINDSINEASKPSEDDKQFWISYGQLVQEIAEPSTSLNALFEKYSNEKYHKVYNEVKEWCNKRNITD